MSHAVESTRLVTFRIGEHLFAAEIQAVQRVLRHEPPRVLPDMPEWMEGVVDYQGTMVPVIDMRRRFGMVASAPGPQARLMVCTAPGGLAALLVDAVLDVKPVQAVGCDGSAGTFPRARERIPERTDPTPGPARGGA